MLIALLLFGTIRAARSSAFLAGEENYVYRQWQTADGLPQNSVTAIAQTPDHYIWVGTFNGLARFDGISFKTYNVRTVPALRSDSVVALLVTSKGDLWISTEAGGITVLSAGRFTAVPGIQDLRIREMIEGKNGQVWLSSIDAFHLYDNGKVRTIAEAKGRFHPFHGLTFDSKNQLCVATGRGLYRWTGEKLEHVVGSTPVRNVMTETDGTIWFWESGKGVARKLGNHSQVVYEADFPPDAIRQASDRSLWVAGGVRKLTRFHDGKWYQVSVEPTQHHDLISIYPDKEGNIWAGLDGGGLLRLREKTLRAVTRHVDGDSMENPITLAQDKTGRIWAGRVGTKAGISWIDPVTFGATKPEGIKGVGWPGSCMVDRSGRVWIGGFGSGLFWWENGVLRAQDPKSEMSLPVLGHIPRVIFEDSKGAVWVGTHTHGVYKYEADKRQSMGTAEGLASDKITAIAETEGGVIWIGTAFGLNRIGQDGSIRRYSVADGLRVNAIHALHSDSRGVLWIGTAGGGLSRFVREKLSTITTAEGLINDVVGQVIEDESGDIWVGTNYGIARLNRNELNDFAEGKIPFVRPMAFTAAEGLPSDECGGGFQPACVRDTAGRLWFVTVRGVVMVDPKNIALSSKPPVMHLQQVIVDGAEMVLSTNRGGPYLEVPPGRSTLEIGFTGIDHSAPERLTYAYKLEGYDADWVNANKRRSAFYTKLPPGEYWFKARAGNNQGLWSETSPPLIVVVEPQWWQSTWFAISAICVLLAGLVGAGRYRQVKELREKQKREEFARRLIESQERERQRVSRELHDSLGQSLLVIKNRAFVAMQEGTCPPDLKAQLSEICEASGDAVQEVRQISQALRPPQLERLGLTRTIEGLVKQLSELGDYEVESSIRSIDNCFSVSDQIHFLRIVQECLNNIIKHSKASVIKLSIERELRRVEFSISDDGCGFDLAERKRRGDGLGMTVIAERVNILKGELEVDSAVAEGTRIRVKIPVKENARREQNSSSDRG